MDEYKQFEFKHSYPELNDTYDFENKQLTANMDKIDFVVSHGHCSDGFMSETIVRKWMDSKGIDTENVTFFKGYHGNDFSKLIEMME